MSATVARGRVSIPVLGERLHLLPERAIWWPRRRTLIVADLHLGKEEALLELGVPMPRGVLEETIARLDSLVRSLSPDRLVVLGDLIHARAGLTAEVVEAFAKWRRCFDGWLDLVPGNHDSLAPVLPRSWGVRRLATAVLDAPFVHVHDARPHAGGYALGGHLHPVVRLRGRLDRLQFPCFVIGTRRAVLPAFTLFSAGVRVTPESGDRIYAIVDGEVMDLSPGACA